MTIQQLKCLCAVVEYGNFSSASEGLYLSQSTVSKSIQALEQTVGFKLIERHGRTSVLTEQGKKLMADIWDITTSYDHLQGIISDIKMVNNPSLGESFKLAAVPVIDELGVVTRFNDFMEQYENDVIYLNVMEENQVLSALNANDCELAFCSDTAIDTSIFHCYPYCKQEFAIFLSTDHQLANRDTIDLSELSDYNLIFPGRESMLLSMCIRTCVNAGFEPQIALTTNRPGIALGYIKNKDFVYVGLDIPYPQVDSTLYRKIPLLNGPWFHYVLARRKNQTLSQSAKRFLAYMCPPDAEK